MKLQGHPWGSRRVAVIDRLSFWNGHCQDAYDWHVQQGLLDKEIQKVKKVVDLLGTNRHE